MKYIFSKAKDIFFLFVWLFLIYNCKQQVRDFSISSIEVDVTSKAELQLSDFFENFHMVSLKSDVVMGEIGKLRFENNYIYISDGKTLFIYSDSGKLSSYFSHRGGGPYEYIGISDFLVDNDTIIVLCRTSQRLLKYNHLGECISVQNLGYWAWAISPTVNQNYFLYSGSDYDSKLRRVRNGQLDSMYLPVDPYLSKFMNFRIRDNYSWHQDIIYFFELFNNTVYSSVGGGGMQPTYYINYKNRNIPASFYKENYANVVEFRQAYNNTSYAHGVFNFAAFDNYLMFVSFYQQEGKWTIFDRKDKISYTFSDLKDDVYFNGLAVSTSKIGYYADKHIFVPIEAFQVVEWREKYRQIEKYKDMINATDADDNPLLLVFDFKK